MANADIKQQRRYMSRARKPTAILEQTGAFKKNPNRKRAAEPEPTGKLSYEPPLHLNEEEKAMWFEIVNIVPPGVLTNSDALIVESLAMLWTRYRLDKSEMPPALISRIDIQMGRLGLSPADRAKLRVDKPRENKFAD